MPLSGGVGGKFGGDLVVDTNLNDETWRVEVKCRKSGWKVIEGQLGPNDFLVLKPDAKTPLVVMRWNMFAMLFEGACCDATEISSPDSEGSARKTKEEKGLDCHV